MAKYTKNETKELKRQKGANSIYRTIALIRTIADYNEIGINLSALARKTNFPVSTVHRIVAVLVSEGLISYDPILKCYKLGFGLYALGHKAYQFSIRDTYRKSIEQIAEITGETVYLVVRSGFDSVCIDLVEGKSPIRIMTYDIGTRRPLGVGAGGLSLIAFLPDNEIKAIINFNSDRYSEYNNISVEKIRTLINTSRHTGHVFNNGNYLAGITAVGVPVYDANGVVIAAISIASISDRMNKKRVADIVKTTQEKIISHH